MKELARGGMGTVYEAEHVFLPRRAAVKVMHPELRKIPGMATRAVQEASLLEDCPHPGTVRIFECNVLPDQRPWIAMELVAGESLAARITRERALSPIGVAAVIAAVADVLTTMHGKGVIHRDLKPDNLLLTPGSEFPLRVIDWGVARLGPAARLTMDDASPGTPIYMSPEQARGTDIGAACDIYSLGVIAYEALTGAPPFDGRTIAEVACMHLTSEPAPLAKPGRPTELCTLIHRMLSKQASDRPTAAQVARIASALADELAGEYADLVIQDARPEDEEPIIEIVVEPVDTHVATSPEHPHVIPRPRWTPNMGTLSSALSRQAPVAGEIVLLEKRR
ncbi:MAG TPA: serine/threonine-protein kinase [Kofleriaceae bacterium]